MTDPLALCLAERLAPQVALARLLLGGETAAGIAARVAAARRPGAAWAALDRLAADAAALDRLRRMIEQAAIDHAGATTPAQVAALFDRAVAVSAEGSVALYSLGDAATLATATAELVAWLRAERLLRPGIDVLDLGCGIGRVAAALAGEARSVVGLDVSPGMLAEAERRCAGLGHVRFVLGAGHDLSPLADASVDLVLAIDSFPYLVQAGLDLAARHVEEAARVLRRPGALAILNLSYRGDPAADRALAAEWAARNGFSLRPEAALPFKLWDATAFVLDR